MKNFLLTMLRLGVFMLILILLPVLAVLILLGFGGPAFLAFIVISSCIYGVAADYIFDGKEG